MPATSPELPRRFGRYTLLERIAAGGMAEVYKAAWEGEGGFRKLCAIKRVLPGLADDDEFIRMFQEEAALTVRLSHANVVQVFDFGRAEGDWFLAMEYVAGPSLRGVLNRCRERNERIPGKIAIWIAGEVAKGLGHAHTRRDDAGAPLGIIHRDVSPSNVLLSWSGEVKITDFGIARMASRASHTSPEMVRGKASYLSPEQASGEPPLDARSDLFALGIVLWETLTGRKLFEADSPAEVLTRVVTAPIPPLAAIIKGVPDAVQELVARALARDRDQRFPDAVAFERACAMLVARLGGVAAADVASFLEARFPEHERSEQLSDVQRQAISANPGVPAGPPRSAPASSAAGFDESAMEPQVERLDDEARARMFDLPARARTDAVPAVPVVPAAPGAGSLDVAPPSGAAPHFLELETGAQRAPADDPSLEVVQRIRAEGIVVHVIRASIVGMGSLLGLLALVKIVWRY